MDRSSWRCGWAFVLISAIAAAHQGVTETAEGEKAGADQGGGASGIRYQTAEDHLRKETRAENRLAKESSPYLLLHARNPVDWYPWGPEAFEKAKTENKPIFLSIGYSSCYWCHVMERETFQNEEIAKALNERFVCIKVDREERPDIDDVYMSALYVYLQATGSKQGGGWPLSMFLTPEGKPIAGGTYFPPEDRMGQRGFTHVLSIVHTAWTERNADVKSNAEILAREVRRTMRPAILQDQVPVDEKLVSAAAEVLIKSHDAEYGGIDFNPQRPNGPKFPVPCKLMFLQSLSAGGNVEAKTVLANTLDHLSRGGIHDHLGGGFFRYSTDRKWLVPHFEKMLYDNAQLAEVYAAAFEQTGDSAHREIATGIVNFLLDELSDPQGGFYSAIDAETEGVEGAHYVWSKAEVETVLGPELAKLFVPAYGLNGPQSFEHGYVLHRERPLKELASDAGVSEEEVATKLAEGRRMLLETRRKRAPLLRDDKVLVSWNGLAIRGLVRSGKVLEDERAMRAAEKAARFILSQCRHESGLLAHQWRGGKASGVGYLDDYAYFVSGLLALHVATGSAEFLQEAGRLTDEQIKLFWDEQAGGFYYTSKEHEELLARTKTSHDAVMPSGNSVSVQNLAVLSELMGKPELKEKALQGAQAFSADLMESPSGQAYLAESVRGLLAGGSGFVAAKGPGKGAKSSPKRQKGSGEETKKSKKSVDEEEEPVVFAKVSDGDLKKSDRAPAKVYLSCQELPIGEKCRLAVVVEIKEGWHINANPAQPDYLIPATIEVSGKLKTEAAKIVYPKGEEFRMADIEEPLSVYEGKVIFVAELEVPAEAAGKDEELQITFRSQACNNKICERPITVRMSGKIPVAAKGAKVMEINRELFREIDEESEKEE